MDIQINEKRFLETLHQLWNTAKKQNECGLNILPGTKENKAVLDLLVSWMKAENLKVQIDDVGNVYGIRSGIQKDRKPLAIGSHVDTVVNGGKYDGILGVIGGLEVIRCLNENHIATEQDLVLCIWANEEGARFLPGMAGSSVVMGNAETQVLLSNCDQKTKETYHEAMQQIGYIGKKENRLTSMEKYLELHIEQGPILEERGFSVGIVAGVKAMAWNQIVVKGESNHAGPCPMHLRKDALLAATHMINDIEQIAVENTKSNTTVTFGHMEVLPDEITIIPKQVKFTQDMRSEDGNVVKTGQQRVKEIVQRVAERYHVSADIQPIGEMPETKFDADIMKDIESAMKHRGEEISYLYSGAGHDAFQIAQHFPVGMIFVRTKNGKSHVPEEYAEDNDIIKGTQILLDTVLLER